MTRGPAVKRAENVSLLRRAAPAATASPGTSDKPCRRCQIRGICWNCRRQRSSWPRL